MEGQKKERTLGEQKAFTEGYIECWSNILENFKDISNRVTRSIEMMVESIEEEADASEKLS